MVESYFTRVWCNTANPRTQPWPGICWWKCVPIAASQCIYYSTNTSLHPSRMLLGNGGLRYSECIHHNRPRPSPATEWNGAPKKRGIQGRVCQFPHDRMEEGPLWTSSWQQNELHLTWWENAWWCRTTTNMTGWSLSRWTFKVDTKKLTRSLPFMQNKHLRETYW